MNNTNRIPVTIAIIFAFEPIQLQNIENKERTKKVRVKPTIIFKIAPFDLLFLFFVMKITFSFYFLNLLVFLLFFLSFS